MESAIKFLIEKYFDFTSTEIATYIIIFLMLITILFTERSTRKHINAVEKTSREQIASMERWSNIKRKQLLKSLIEELNHNVILYNQLIDESKMNKYSQKFNNFIFIRGCLTIQNREKKKGK